MKLQKITIQRIDDKHPGYNGWIYCIKVLKDASSRFDFTTETWTQGVTAGLKEAKECVDDLKICRPRTVDVNPDKIQMLIEHGFIITNTPVNKTYTMDLTTKLVSILGGKIGNS
jgi:hypothetical protein